jgi:hypothetical protein
MSERFKIFKNDEGIYRVQVQDSLGGRWLLDEDLMVAIFSSHKSKILDFYSEDQAQAAINQVLTKERLLRDRWVAAQPQTPAPVPSDTFKPIKA